MRKLKLEVEALRVDSFETTERGREADGTVHGHSGAPECGPFHEEPDPNPSGLPCYSDNLSCPTGGNSCNYCVSYTPAGSEITSLC